MEELQFFCELGDYKGQNGKTATIGGCLEYTGAPYYAAVSSLKTGSDLAHIFWTKGAGIPIKSYSPEVITHPILIAQNENEPIEPSNEVADDVAQQVIKWFGAVHAFIVGPGLGRDSFLCDHIVKRILNQAIADEKIVVVDADGLNLLCREPIDRAGSKTILTPNVVEFKRLWTAYMDTEVPTMPELGKRADLYTEIPVEEVEAPVSLANRLGCMVFLKGPSDIITDGTAAYVVQATGSAKRSGGIGDILSGALSTGLHKANKAGQPLLKGAVAASLITRFASAMAYEQRGISMTAPDIIENLYKAVMKFSGRNAF